MTRTAFIVAAGIVAGIAVTLVWQSLRTPTFADLDECMLHGMKNRQLALLPVVKRDCDRILQGQLEAK